MRETVTCVTCGKYQEEEQLYPSLQLGIPNICNASIQVSVQYGLKYICFGPDWKKHGRYGRFLFLNWPKHKEIFLSARLTWEIAFLRF